MWRVVTRKMSGLFFFKANARYVSLTTTARWDSFFLFPEKGKPPVKEGAYPNRLAKTDHKGSQKPNLTQTARSDRFMVEVPQHRPRRHTNRDSDIRDSGAHL